MVWHVQRTYYYDRILQDVVAYMEEGKARYIGGATADSLALEIERKGYRLRGTVENSIIQGYTFSKYGVHAEDERGELFAVETYLPPRERQ